MLYADKEDLLVEFNTALPVWRDYYTVDNESWCHKCSYEVGSSLDKKSRRPDDAVGCVSDMSHVDTCNLNSFYLDFSCMNNSQCYISNTCIDDRWWNAHSEVHSESYDNENHNCTNLSQMTGLHRSEQIISAGMCLMI